MINLSKQALVFAALALPLECQSREPPASRKADATNRIDDAVTARRETP
jgi:hypothetical protein